MKRKGVVLHGGGMRKLCKSSPQVSGRGPGGYWITSLPYCNTAKTPTNPYTYGTSGFSINGGQRNVTYVGKIRRQYGTPYRGPYPCGQGGNNGNFSYQIVLNMNPAKAEIEGNQYKFIKPSSQMTKTMLNKKYSYIYHGQYPTHWVQPTYPSGSLDQNASMSSYIQKLKTQNSIFLFSKESKGDCQDKCQSTTGSKKNFNQTNLHKGDYTKTLHQPVKESDYLQHVQRKCLNPKGKDKPFPFNALNNSNNGFASTTTLNGPPPVITTEYYNAAPEWYLKDNCL